MQKLEEAIRELIKDTYGSVAKFAEKIDVPLTSVYSALDRGLANTRTELTDKIYRELNIDWDTALLGNDFKELKTKKSRPTFVDIPLYGSIAAGAPLEMMSADDTYPIPARLRDKYPHSFLLKVEGESMNKVLPNGCYALINPCNEVAQDNNPYAVCVNGFDATIKRVKKLANGFQLIPDSNDPTYAVRTYNFNEPDTETITVIGKVVWYCIPFDWKF